MAYVGQGIKGGTFSVLDTSGNTYNGSNVTFNLGTQVSSPAQLLVSHDGVIQKPVTDYTIATGGTQITFTTAPASGASIFITEISGAVGAPMNRDINGDELILDADADTSITADTDDQIDIRIAGADDFQFTANTFTAQSGSTITTPTLGVGTARDLGVLHVRSADSSGGVSADADELVLENSGHAGVTIASGNSSNGNIYFSDSGNSAIGYIQYGHDNNDLTIVTNDTGGTLIDSGGRLATGGEAAPDADPGGITVDTNTSDSNNSEFMTFKNAATNHGFTDFGEADTNGRIETQSDNGGLMFSGLTENDTPFLFKGYVNASNTYKSAQGQGAFAIYLGYTDGSTGVTTTYGANSNLFSIRRAMSGNNTVFLVDEDGDVLYDGSTSAYDEYDDAHLIRAYDQYKAPDAIIQNKFDKFVKYNRQSLIDAKLIGDCPIEEERAGTNKPLVSLTGFQRLHNGAIWQQYTKHQQLLEAVYDLAKEAVGEDKADAILEKHEIKRLQ